MFVLPSIPHVPPNLVQLGEEASREHRYFVNDQCISLNPASARGFLSVSKFGTAELTQQFTDICLQF
jgi:hypothetical protein